MDMETIFLLVGGFGTLALSINAFFLKGIYSDLNAVKVSIAEILVRSKDKERRIAELEDNEKGMVQSLQSCRERIHSLEGAQEQILEYIKEN